ncbi:hypothetical protein [Bradyrhizobium sp. SZCCHNS3053]|uniref:hypothetical protein n=1 Tax=Bradyrhizobium sp. SZCCHNS3053 TaxID=3057322 RepID=UPI002915E996|nr:hypothetical protein [Bradyrhizobium sp. SZCCHNS3053]
MFGAQGFRAREAAANYKRRERRLVPDEVRAIRFANLHGNAEAPKVEVADQVEPEVTAETQVEAQADQTEQAEKKAGKGKAKK